MKTKIPEYVLEKFEKLIERMNFGDVTLRCQVKEGKPRYVVGFEESFLDRDIEKTAIRHGENK